MEYIQSEKGKSMYIDGNYIFQSDGFNKLDDQLLFNFFCLHNKYKQVTPLHLTLGADSE